MTPLKAQSAMEYLTTYGWAILIIAVVVSVLAASGFFSAKTYTRNFCIFPADFSCVNGYLASTGNFFINLQQSTTAPINITAMGCNTNATVAYMTQYAPPVYLQIGNNVTKSVACFYINGTAYVQPPGTVFRGYFIINYTDLQTGFPHTEIGKLQEVVT